LLCLLQIGNFSIAAYANNAIEEASHANYPLHGLVEGL